MWQKYRFYAFMLGCALSFYAYRESVKETENLEKQSYTTEKEYANSHAHVSMETPK